VPRSKAVYILGRPEPNLTRTGYRIRHPIAVCLLEARQSGPQDQQQCNILVMGGSPAIARSRWTRSFPFLPGLLVQMALQHAMRSLTLPDSGVVCLHLVSRRAYLLNHAVAGAGGCAPRFTLAYPGSIVTPNDRGLGGSGWLRPTWTRQGSTCTAAERGVPAQLQVRPRVAFWVCTL